MFGVSGESWVQTEAEFDSYKQAHTPSEPHVTVHLQEAFKAFHEQTQMILEIHPWRLMQDILIPTTWRLKYRTKFKTVQVNNGSTLYNERLKMT